MAETAKKPWRVVRYDAARNQYQIDYYNKAGAKCATYSASRDDRRGMFFLRLEVRYPYREVPGRRAVYFDECTWEI